MAGKIKNQETEQPTLTQKEELVLKAQSLGVKVEDNDTVPLLQQIVKSVEEYNRLNKNPLDDDPEDVNDLYKQVFVKIACNNPKLMEEKHIVLSFANDRGKFNSVFIHLDYEDLTNGIWLSKWAVKLLKQRKFVQTKPNKLDSGREDGFILDLRPEFTVTFDPSAYANAIAIVLRHKYNKSKTKPKKTETTTKSGTTLTFGSPKTLDVATVDESDLIK